MRYISDRLLRPGRAFTLVELLVVVAIIAILMALLLPSLAAAKAQAQAVRCAANMRTIGTLFNVYAAEHGGRLPNTARSDSRKGYTGLYDDLGWEGILNFEMLRNHNSVWPGPNEAPEPHIWTIRRPFPWSRAVRAKALTCWSYEPANGELTCCYVYNSYANGWHIFNNGDYAGSYGVQADAAMIRDVAPFYYESVDKYTIYDYYLGAPLKSFNANQILVAETRGGSTPIFFSVSNANGAGWLPAGFQGETRRGDTFAFRHPLGKGGNFLFFDAHVERLPPDWRQICTRQRLNLE